MKKFLSLALVLVMALSLAACTGTASSTPASTGADTSTPAASTAGTLKIGGIGPLTGGAAVYGTAVKNAAELAVADYNATHEMQIELNFQDDEHDAEKSVNAYNNLKDWGMQVLLGTVTTGPALAVINEAETDNMFMLTPSASAVEVVAPKTVFQVCFTDPNQGVASADYIADNALATKVAVIFDSSDAYSTGIKDKFVAQADVKGLEVVAAEAFTADSKTDFSVQVQKAKAAGAELVFLPIYYNEANLIVQEMKKQSFDASIFGCDGLDGLLDIEGADVSLFEDIMLLTPFAADAQDEATQTFVAAYKEKYGEVPNQFAADAYDGIFIIMAAMEASGATADMDAATLGDMLTEVMTTISVDGLTGAGMKWDASGTVNKAPIAVKIVNGAYVSM